MIIKRNARKNKKYAKRYMKSQEFDYALSAEDICDSVLRNVRQACELATFKMDSSAISEYLDFVIDLVKADLQAELNAAVVYSSTFPPDRRRSLMLPFIGWCQVSQVKINSAKNTVVTNIYDHRKLVGAVKGIKEDGFISSPSLYNGVYYPELNMIIVSNGLHHSCVAEVMGESGFFKVDVYHLSELFPVVEIRGNEWVHKERPDDVRPVEDAKMAILFSLAKYKAELEQSLVQGGINNKENGFEYTDCEYPEI